MEGPRGRRTLIALALAAPLIVAVASPAAAYDLTGCELTVTSLDDAGQPVSAAQGPGSGGTLADPFVVHPKGIVHYEGRTLTVIMHHTWHVDVYGIPIMTGGHDNEGGDTEGVGDVSVAQYAADRAAGLYYVSGALVGEGGTCTGGGWVKLSTDPVGTIPWLLGLALVGLGLVTLAFAMPNWRSVTVVEAPGPPPGRP